MIDLGRLVTAMVTPFDAELNVDRKQTERLVEHLIATGSTALVVAGTTGESPTLTGQEKVNLFRHVVEIVNGRIPVIAGTGSNNTAASIELTQKAAECGVDGVMLVVPYYNKPSQEGLYQHFKTIAASTKLPVLLYNIPGRSVINMKAETTIRLANDVGNIFAIKEANSDLGQMSEIIEQTADDFVLYTGDDSMTLPCMSVGGKGVISVASHVIGREMSEMIQAFAGGEVARASALHRKLLPVFEGLFITANPTPVKAALNMQGINVGGVRLPLVELTEEEREFVKNLLPQVEVATV
ncbi:MULTISPECIES: 4-hydroxy-tetrahydrodipicolinate synthase [Aneurinibacillus]|jgi:4-hydroxy-tetrahydrodipicolinate synthase|uniref:4-hydroxy-tetrahydrodipicolinate synthase n=1 Tax=Aneurinibacillus danicus TaxID=267746 RepID=A0A511V787_9BACL|nr:MULTISPECIES: 4-hydroxy-tetrahydrodipicolinate synthase [Aneurinibacillus]GEN34001.1 4-hydroxy-tetrahydrodipicolinate synthase [Aneurinibacillus danicus]